MTKRIVLFALTALVAVLVGTAARLLTTFEEPAVDPSWRVESSPEIPEGSVTVRYAGTSTLLFSDGATDWMVDGWFTRFGPLEFIFSKIGPDEEAIARGLAARALADPLISEPLVPPVSAMDYRVGQPYAIHVSHPLGRWLIQGSAGYIEEGLSGYEAAIVFLGVGGLGAQNASYREAYWRETVTRTGADRVIPIHWDSLMGKAEGPFTGPVRASSFVNDSGGEQTLEFLKGKEASDPGLQFSALPRFDEIVLFRAL